MCTSASHNAYTPFPSPFCPSPCPWTALHIGPDCLGAVGRTQSPPKIAPSSFLNHLIHPSFLSEHDPLLPGLADLDELGAYLTSDPSPSSRFFYASSFTLTLTHTDFHSLTRSLTRSLPIGHTHTCTYTHKAGHITVHHSATIRDLLSHHLLYTSSHLLVPPPSFFPTPYHPLSFFSIPRHFFLTIPYIFYPPLSGHLYLAVAAGPPLLQYSLTLLRHFIFLSFLPLLPASCQGLCTPSFIALVLNLSSLSSPPPPSSLTSACDIRACAWTNLQLLQGENINRISPLHPLVSHLTLLSPSLFYSPEFNGP